MSSLVLLSVMVFVLIAQAAWLGVSALRDRGAVLEVAAQRLEDYTRVTWDTSLPDAASIRRRRRYSRLPWLDALLARFDMGDALAQDLLRAGVAMRAGEFLFVQLVLATVAGFAAFLALPNVQGGLIPAAVAGTIGFLAPLVWLRMRRGRRLARFEADLPDALDLVAGSLRAGYGLAHGFEAVARENQGPCGEEFGQVLQEVSLGAEVDTALARVVERVESEDARLLATAVAVQRRTGGNLINVLTQMAHVLRERQRLRREVQVITTAPRVSGYVVSLLPVMLAIAMYFLSRYYVMMLFEEPLGRVALIVSGILVLVGLYLNRRIATVDM